MRNANRNYEMWRTLFKTAWIRVPLVVAAAMASYGFEIGLPARAAEPDIVRVAILSGEGVSAGAPQKVAKCFDEEKSFAIDEISGKDIQAGALERYDVLICPGGSGSGQAKALGKEGRDRVHQFVKDGGGFVGICAGAYLASAEYPWALKLLDAKVVDDEHWARGTGEVVLELPKSGQVALHADRTQVPIAYENGPLLAPAKNSQIPDFESLATFASEIRENDAPVGIMKGTTAIARGKLGQGRVVCFSPHPERSKECQRFVVAMVRWAGEN